MNLTAYFVCMAASAVLTAVFTAFLLIRGGVPGKRAAGAGCLLLFSGCLLGFAGAKLLYLLLEFPYVMMRGLGEFFLETRAEELSYYGGVAGVTLAAFLTAKILKLDPVHFLNSFAPAGAFMAGMARISEYFLGLFGAGDYMEQGGFFPLTVQNSWGEHYLAVFFLEGVFALVMAVFALLNRKDRQVFVRTLFYLCLSQILFESLRNQSIAWLFVRAEQLLCFFFVEGVLIFRSVTARRLGNRKGWLPWVLGILVALLTVAEEFALDKTDIPQVLTYICMTAGIVFLGVVEVLTHRWIRAEKAAMK